jgi:hypothetical protein
MPSRRFDEAEPDVGNVHRQGGVADQGGFEDQFGEVATGGGLDEAGLAYEGVLNGAPSEANLMVNDRNRRIEDEAGYDEEKDLHPGLYGGRPIVMDPDDR